MSDAILPTQGALLANLIASTGLGVYDNVPQETDPPYVVMGDPIATEYDTDGKNGVNILWPIHVFSEQRGRKQTLEIQAQIYSSLHRAELTVSGYNFIGSTQESATVLNDPDGVTRHGVQQFRFLLIEG